ncbi:MAG: pyridoxal-phosphate dependent enzyme [Candidatus Promineifilaceae bacterium]
MTELHPSQISAVAERLAGIVNRTPVLTSRTLNEITGNQVFLKCENFQRVGAFKFRGAYNAVSQLSQAERAAGVVTHSSGNHAQGLSLAAKLLGVPATIVMPEDAPRIKKEATAGYGATVITCKAIDREKVTAELVEKHGYTLVHPYDNYNIILGAGTSAWELFEQVGELDLLFVPVGGGGLISGCALAAAAASPNCRVVGVEPEIAADAGRSWRENSVHTLNYVPQTVADGLRTRFVGQRDLPIMHQYVHDMATASEEAILETLYFIWQRMKVIVEPSSAVALAPVFTGSYDVKGKRIGILISGGNVDMANLPFTLPGSKTTKIESRPVEVSPIARPEPPRAKQPIKPQVLICTPIDEQGLNILKEAAEVDVRPNLKAEELQKIIGRYHGLIVDDTVRVSGQAIEYGFRLRVIGCTGSRLDNIDVSAARSLGVEIRYRPASNTVAMAEHTMSLMLALAGRFSNEDDDPGLGLAGKTVGIIGFGRIGRQVAQRAVAFDMRVIVNQPRLTPELALAAGVEVTDLNDLLREADFVSLHVPFKAETETLIGSQELALMKPGAFLVNTAHTDLVDDDALLAALGNNQLAGAALAAFAPRVEGGEIRPSAELRNHPHVIPAHHITAFRSEQRQKAARAVAQQMVEILRIRQPDESLSLEIVPTELVMPHEQIDDKRVQRLMGRLEEDGRLVNPPLVTFWDNKYVILDGATRFTALKRLNFPYVIVQVVPADSEEFTLHTWYHVISGDRPFSELMAELRQIKGLKLSPLPVSELQTAFNEEKDALCYFLDRHGKAVLAQSKPGPERLAVMNKLVNTYTHWGTVERTLLTDLGRLLAQFPQMAAVAVFPQFRPETVFNVASRGDFLPAGLTRFVIPGRILRLNADLDRLKKAEPLANKRQWFNQFLEDKLARSRLRYYQEPVVLLDE